MSKLFLAWKTETGPAEELFEACGTWNWTVENEEDGSSACRY